MRSEENERCSGIPDPNGSPEEDSGESQEEAHKSAQDDCQLESFQA